MRNFSSILTFLRPFIIKGMVHFTKSFFYISLDNHVDFLPNSINCVFLIILNNTCIPGINSIWSWCIIILMCSWVQFANFFFQDFYLNIHKEYGTVTFFPCDVFWLCNQSYASLIEWVEKCSLLLNFFFFFLEESEKDWY